MRPFLVLLIYTPAMRADRSSEKACDMKSPVSAVKPILLRSGSNSMSRDRSLAFFCLSIAFHMDPYSAT